MNPYNYFPMTYQNQYYTQQQQQQQTPQAFNGGYVTVRSEEEARNYPVAMGASVTFFNETQPFCYKKSAGTSPLDPPTFEVYKILKVGSDVKPQNNTEDNSISSEISALKKQVAELQDKYNELIRQKESEEDVKSINKQDK